MRPSISDPDHDIEAWRAARFGRAARPMPGLCAHQQRLNENLNTVLNTESSGLHGRFGATGDNAALESFLSLPKGPCSTGVLRRPRNLGACGLGILNMLPGRPIASWLMSAGTVALADRCGHGRGLHSEFLPC